MHPATTESVAYVSAQANTIAEMYPRADRSERKHYKEDVIPRRAPFIQDKPRDSGERTNDYTRAPYLGLKPLYKTMNQGSASKGQYRHHPR